MSRPERWRRRGAALAIGLAAVATACSGDGGSDDALPATSTASSAPTTDTTAAAPATVDAVAALVDELAAVPTDHAFGSRTLVDGVEALVLEGRRVAGAVAMTVTSADATVDYVVAADGSTWVRPDGATDWEPDDPLPVGDPLDVLRAPDAVRILGDGAYEARYPAAAFGVTDVDTLVLRLDIVGTEVTFTYTTSSVSVEGRVGPLDDTAPVEIPAGA